MKKIFLLLLPIFSILFFSIRSEASYTAPNGEVYEYYYVGVFHDWNGNHVEGDVFTELYIDKPCALLSSNGSGLPYILIDDHIEVVTTTNVRSYSCLRYGSSIKQTVGNGYFTVNHYPYTTYSHKYYYDSLSIEVFELESALFDYLVGLNSSFNADFGKLILSNNIESSITRTDNPISINYAIKFGWLFNTSSGFNMLDSNYSNLQLEITPRVSRDFYDIGGSTVATQVVSGNPITVNAKSLNFSYDSNSLYNSLPSIPHDVSFSGYKVYVSFDIRIVNKGLGYSEYGDSTNLVFDFGNQGITTRSVYVTYSPNNWLKKAITPKIYDYVQPDPDSPIYPDSPFDPTLPDIPTDDLIKGIQSLLSYVSVVPLALATLLSFLPTWVTTLISTSVSLSVILLLWKLIRG